MLTFASFLVFKGVFSDTRIIFYYSNFDSLQALFILNKYFVRYKWRLLFGLLFVAISNVFAILSPQIVRETLDEVYSNIALFHDATSGAASAAIRNHVLELVMWAGIWLLVYALLRGIFMFFMRQTIIVMSRHIEYDQKNEIFDHYQRLSTAFFKNNATGDLMSRISEDVSRVRMYTGPAIMYIINLVVLISLCLWKMFSVSTSLTLYVIIPLPLLAFSIFYVNKIVNRKSEKIQAQLSDLTAQAQESYSGIRVIKSFAQEASFIERFGTYAKKYRKSTINLSLTEAVYMPAMTLFVGLSMLLTVFIGGWQAIEGRITVGNIAEFVIYINMLMFPISAIGWTANMVQRAIVSQRRINEFLLTKPDIESPDNGVKDTLKGAIEFRDVTFTYPHTGIVAVKHFSIKINAGEKVAIMGKTGSGKSSLIHLLLRMYDVESGTILIDGHPLQKWDLTALRSQIGYVPQEVFLFSDTVNNNIALSNRDATSQQIQDAAKLAAIDTEIEGLVNGYATITGERGVMLSGGQKQRIAIARALLKSAPVLILDDSLSAVDSRTEHQIQSNLSNYLSNKTAIVVTHRVFKGWNFDKIIILDEGKILEWGTHDQLMNADGYYAHLYTYQTAEVTNQGQA